MDSKFVCQLNEKGYFVGMTIADESPLEPGVFHIPGGCIEATPPEIPEGQCARWDGAAWQLEQIPAPSQDPSPPNEEQPSIPKSLADEKANAIESVRKAAYKYITAVYPEYKQLNIFRDYMTLKESPEKIPEENKDVVASSYAAMTQYIDEARVICNEAETAIRNISETDEAAGKEALTQLMGELEQQYGSYL